LLDFLNNLWGLYELRKGRRSKKFYLQIEHFIPTTAQHSNKYNGNIFLIEGSDLFPSSAANLFSYFCDFKKDIGDGEVGILNSD
jgi:hypothetical protein